MRVMHVKAIMAIGLAVASVSSTALADETQAETDTAEPPKSIEQRLADQERRFERMEAAHQEQLEQIKAQFEAQVEALKETVEEQTAAASQREISGYFEDDAEDEPEHSLSLHGFFDFTFSKAFLDKNSAANSFLASKSSFMLSTISVYLAAKMTESFSTVVELGFSTLPRGTETSFDTYNADGTIKFTDYQRNDAMTIYPLTTDWIFMGGVFVQRAYLSWKPRDWFQLKVGKYLTPYGIWNVDHGPTVVLPAHVPYMQIRRIMPLEQTGIQLHGRVFPKDDVYFDYDVTLSNGRSDTIFVDMGDYDENKGVGLGLNLTIDKSRWFLKIGAYGYYGKVTDRAKESYIDLDSGSFSLRSRDTWAHYELVLSGHALFEAFGLRLQGEYVWQHRDVTQPRPYSTQEMLFMGANPLTDQFYSPSGIGWGAYGLLAYQLPLNQWLQKTRVIPFFLYEYVRSNETIKLFNKQFVIGGLNIRPSAWVALKLEYLYVIPEDEKHEGKIHMLAAQAAVSF